MTEPAARSGANALIWPAALLVVSALGWGILYSLNRLATTDGIPFIPYVFWMGTGAALILLGLGAAFRTLPGLSWEHVRGYLALGTISFGMTYTILAFVAPKVPAGVLGLGATLTPILTYPAAALLGMDRFRAIRTVGLVLGVGGVALVVAPETSLPTPDMAPWVLLSFAAPVLYVANALIIAWLKPPPAGALPLAGGVLTTGALFMFVVMAATGQWWWFEGPMTAGDWALAAAAGTMALVFYLMVEIIRLAGPVFFTTVNFMIPLTGIGWGVLFFGESHSHWIWLALVLMLAGLFLVNRPSAPRDGATDPAS
ncbi:MAG: DMT family transporter [Rhodospirillales bacterium]|nr:DMT family transporter [Rhodospirillales bacterium]MDE0379917.1 DMT family transporter [Rhodospirillales bacterium]